MVKRAITVILISLTLVTVGLIECLLVKDVVVDLDNRVGELITKYELNKNDVTPLINEIDDIKKQWDNHENILCIVFNHKDMSIITDGLSKLRSYTENNNYDDGIVELKLLKENTEKQPHVMGFNIHNIL